MPECIIQNEFEKCLAAHKSSISKSTNIDKTSTTATTTPATATINNSNNNDDTIFSFIILYSIFVY